MPFSSSNKRIREMPSDDRLSELPDCLLIHILSFLGVKRAGVTSVLSKRWKCLLSELPRLEFCLKGALTDLTPVKAALNFVSWVNRTIDIRKGNSLDMFMVDFFLYDRCFASDVDEWVQFSMKNKVKQLILELSNCSDNSYTLPLSVYSCSSLTTLKLRGCIVTMEEKIKWQSLTDLILHRVKLNQHLLDEVLSSCPVLNNLELRSCCGFNRLEATSPCLNSLTIEDCDMEDEPDQNELFVEISAPYIHILNIVLFADGRKWQLKNISSVHTASIDFFDFYGAEMMDNAREFLENFKHVNDLHLEELGFKNLSEMAVNGWQLPQFRLRNLKIESSSGYELGIFGIICLLESSPNLETLLLDGYETYGEIVSLHPAGAKGDLNGDLLHLKKIRVNNFADPNGEPLLTLAQILLNRAPVLEEMVIVVDVLDIRAFINISRALLTYSRSSAKAKIHLSHKMIQQF